MTGRAPRSCGVTGSPPKREAVNLALRTLAVETASVDEARALRGIGWEGDLDAMRSNRVQIIVDTWIGPEKHGKISIMRHDNLRPSHILKPSHTC